ncbi:MAG TPA: site-2 protease family protein [Candidatus Acidoferrales bacterium]
MSYGNGNGNGRVPVEIISLEAPPRDVAPRKIPKPPRPYRSGRSFAIALILFLITIISTLAAGVDFSLAYARGQMPSFDNFFHVYFLALRDPRVLLAGLPFAFTLMGILLAHELGHYFTCRYYGMTASYPYFIPFPSLFGTMGAFIRIRSAITNRKALFDVGLSGPVVGFLFTVPALAFAIAHSKIVPGVAAASGSQIAFGEPMLMRMLMAILRPHVLAQDLLLHPVGRAAWIGLFVTSLNLLPASQLDGGHILYALAQRIHKRATLIVAATLGLLAFQWLGWIVWAVLLLAIGYRHPPLIDRCESLDRKRFVWAAVGLAIFVLSFMPVPIIVPKPWF